MERKTGFECRVLGALSLAVCVTALAACRGESRSGSRKLPIAVEVAPVVKGAITSQRTFQGSLEAASEYIVSPRIGGRIERIHVDLGDTVSSGQLIVELDDDEYRQQVAQAAAELSVAKANVLAAKAGLDIAEREYERVATLRERGVASDTRFDEASGAFRAASARSEIAAAETTRAEAALQGARVRLRYTRIEATWSEGALQRVVAARYLDEGATVQANSPILTVVELSPLVGVIHVPEADDARLSVGQSVSLTTDARPGEQSFGTIWRIAPVVRPESRQVRVELLVENADYRLKPGAFIRATVEVDRAVDATIVPRTALANRSGKSGVFLVDGDGTSVSWRVVRVGIGDDERVQILEPELSGRVVTLGQQLLADGAAISVEERGVAPASGKSGK